MKLTRTQKLTALLAIMVLILAAAAVIVSFAGGKAQTKPLFTGSAQLTKPDVPDLAFERYPTGEEEAGLANISAQLKPFLEDLPRHAEILMPFYEKSTRQILSGHDGQNQVYSPLNLYMALSMAAEITDGSTRGQILDLLGAQDIESLREQSKDMWLLNSCSFYGSETDLGNSLWLNNSIDYKQETLDILANDHFAESFRGEPNSPEYDAMLQEWTNEKTHNLLEDSVGGLHMDPTTVLTLMSTVYFKGTWLDQFSEEDNTVQPFHAANGDGECTFMHQSCAGSYFRGEHFGAVSMYFNGIESMTFILPDEDSGVDQLLSEDGDLWDFFDWRVRSEADHSTTYWKDSTRAILNISLPKFDVSSDSELSEDLKSLGITEAFDPYNSNFDPLMHNDIPAYISGVNHAARVMVDEEGCTAASYVEMLVAAGASAPPELEIDFTLDRPFIFLIQTRDGWPLFAGVVNHP